MPKEKNEYIFVLVFILYTKTRTEYFSNALKIVILHRVVHVARGEFRNRAACAAGAAARITVAWRTAAQHHIHDGFGYELFEIDLMCSQRA